MSGPLKKVDEKKTSMPVYTMIIFLVSVICEFIKNILCITFSISPQIPCRPSTQVGGKYGKRQWTSGSETD